MSPKAEVKEQPFPILIWLIYFSAYTQGPFNEEREGEREGGIGGGTGGSWAALSYASSREMVYSTKQVVEEDCGEDE